MKMTLKTISITVAMFLGVMSNSVAQSFEPTTSWPYIYPDFIQGQLIMTSGKTLTGLYNICLEGSTLHFIEGEMVKEASTLDIISVQIGNDIYVNAGGKIIKTVGKAEKGVVAVENIIDMAKLNETGGAYGSSSSTNATMSLSSLEGIGGRANMNHMELKNAKESGRVLPIITKYYLVFNGKSVPANKKDIDALEGIDKDALKSYYKSNKIKWRDPASLCSLIDFIAKQQSTL